jgi:predicted acyltransferase
VGRLILQALCRSLVLVGLGIFLVTGSKKQPDFLFVNVLAQIGLGYVFLLPLVGRSARVQVAAMAALGIACWAAFATHPLPVPGLDLGSLGITPNLAEDVVLPGFFGHWSMNTNFAADFDRWFLNLFPRETPFAFEAGGYQTLNFVPSIITMILGLMAAERLRGPGGGYDHLRWLVAMGAGCLALGLLAGATVCPIVKRIWTPSWALASGGVCLWLVALFYWLIDIRGWRGWAWPLVVVGMNSIAFYLAYQLLRDWIKARAATYLGSGMFAGTFGPVWQNLIVLGVLWLWCWWLYRRQIFLRV